ncbi:MAG: phosphatase PAP2 family protein [Chthoniobacteraceae bacterium]|jgi:membrane-associated phospholipid phosphatase
MNRARPLRLLPFVIGAGIVAGSFLLDGQIVAWVAAHRVAGVQEAARLFTKWGDFPPIVALLLGLLLIGWVMKRPAFTRVVLLMLGSAIAGGLAANVLRVLTGRTRPSASIAPGWYGLWNHGVWIAGKYEYSSFPSAHTAVAIACIVPLWLLTPGRWRMPVAVPATMIALCIAASRILLNAHHLSDVLASVWLGSLIGWLICQRVGLKRGR